MSYLPTWRLRSISRDLSATRSPALRREKSERARLDALARRRLRARAEIVERGVRGEPRPAALFRVEHLEHEHLVAPHFGEIEPAVGRVVAQPVRLTHAVRIAALGDEQIPGRDAARIGDRERVGPN